MVKEPLLQPFQNNRRVGFLIQYPKDGIVLAFISQILLARHFDDIDSHDGGQRKLLLRKSPITALGLVLLHERLECRNPFLPVCNDMRPSPDDHASIEVIRFAG
jgi:hypothetical protein